jgi:hypothetical protein
MASVASDQSSTMPRGRKRRDVTGKIVGRKFACETAGCGRSFTRAEHLQRHLLNHSTGEHTCNRCRAHFKRRDLLGKTTFPYHCGNVEACMTWPGHATHVLQDYTVQEWILLSARCIFRFHRFYTVFCLFRSFLDDGACLSTKLPVPRRWFVMICPHCTLSNSICCFAYCVALHLVEVSLTVALEHCR